MNIDLTKLVEIIDKLASKKAGLSIIGAVCLMYVEVPEAVWWGFLAKLTGISVVICTGVVCQYFLDRGKPSGVSAGGQ